MTKRQIMLVENYIRKKVKSILSEAPNINGYFKVQLPRTRSFDTDALFAVLSKYAPDSWSLLPDRIEQNVMKAAQGTKGYDRNPNFENGIIYLDGSNPKIKQIMKQFSLKG